jgi:hypothetical protein
MLLVWTTMGLFLVAGAVVTWAWVRDLPIRNRTT